MFPLRQHGSWLLVLLALLLFIVCAPAAHATTYWVATDGNSAWTGRDSSGGSPDGPKTTGWLATAALQPGDLVRFTHQSFRGVTITTTASGTAASPITIYGDSLYPASVVCKGINIPQTYGADRYLRVIGFRCTNWKQTGAGSSNTPDGFEGIIGSRHSFIGNCVFDSLFLNAAGSSGGEMALFGHGTHFCHVYKCQFGNATTKSMRPDHIHFKPQDGITGECSGSTCGYTAIGNYACTQDSLSFCTLYVNHTNSGSSTEALSWRFTDTCYFVGNVFNAEVQEGAATGISKFYGNQHTYWGDNRWNFRSFVTTRQNEDGMMYVRDCTQFCTWERDTFNFLGSTTLQCYLVNSGSCAGSNRQNTFDHCFFYDSCGVTAGGEGRIELHDSAHRETFTNNVVVSRNAECLTQTGSGDSCDSCTVENNTFVTIAGDQPAVYFAHYSNANGTFRNNVCYSVASTARALTIPAGLLVNYNDYHAAAGTDSAVVNATALSTRCAAGNDCNSIAGDPLLIGGATYSNTYNARLRPASPARFVGFNGLDIGAFQFGDPLPRVYQYWVSPTARAVHPGLYTATGSDSTQPITLQLANEIAEPGARFILLGGDYTADASHTEYLCGAACNNAALTAENGNGIAPITGGMSFDSTLSVVYCSEWYYENAMRGVTSAPDTNSYRVSGIVISQPYVKVQGITCSALTAYSATSNGASCGATTIPTGAYCFRAQLDSITWCKATTLQLGGCDQVYLNNCWIVTPRTAGATGQTTARNAIYGAYNSLANLPGCTQVGITDSYFGCYLNWGQAGLQVGAHSGGVTFTRCKLNCELQPAAQPSTATDTLHFVELRDCSDVRFVDCRWRVNCTAGETTPLGATTDSLNAMALLLKDGAQFVTFLRDTMDLGYRSYNAAVIQLRAQGGLAASVNNVLWQDCIVRGDWLLLPQVRCSRWSFLRDVLGTQRLSPLYEGQYGSTDLNSDTLLVDHCTLYSDGANPALVMNLPGTVKKVQLTRNLYYRTATAVATTGAICNYGACIGAAPAFKADENIYWSNTDSLQNAAFVTNWARTGLGPDSVYTYGSGVPINKLSDYSPLNEKFSLYGNPSLVAASVDSTFDGSLNCSSASYRSKVPQYYYSHGDSSAGAFQPSDSYSPGVCTNVTADITLTTPTTLTIKFTGGANNAATGVGTPSGYWLAYATNPNITEGNFFTKSLVSVTGATPGNAVSKQLTSLANSTIYYFAVKTIGQCGSLSPMSTVGCSATHTGADAVSPHLCDQ